MNDFTPFTPDELKEAEICFTNIQSHISDLVTVLTDMYRDEKNIDTPHNREWASVRLDEVSNSLEQLSLSHKTIAAGGYTSADEQKKEELYSRQVEIFNDMKSIAHPPQQNWAEKIASELSPTRFLG